MESEAASSTTLSQNSSNNHRHSEVTIQSPESYEIEQIFEEDPQFHPLLISLVLILVFSVIILVFALTYLIFELDEYTKTLLQIDKVLKA